MSEEIVYVRATRAEIRQAMACIPAGAFGGFGARSIADQMMERCGLAALGHIHKAFITKARGGTDEAGESWKSLSPKTIVGRRGNRTRTEKKRAKEGNDRPSVALNARQRDRWWDVYRQQLARFKGNKSAAARNAWTILKSEGAQTLLSKYGNRKVDILRDTGILLNSLSPGTDSNDQVFRIGRGEVIVGTNVPYAIIHHIGNSHVPQRRLWPEPRKWPSNWWLDIAETARSGLVDIARFLIKGFM